MTTLSKFLELLRNGFPDAFRIHYIHPTLYVVCESERFAGVPEDVRKGLLAGMLGVSESEILGVTARANIELILAAESEISEDYGFLTLQEGGSHWLSWYGQLASQKSSDDAPTPPPSRPKAVHFYGMKGGQARTTVMLLLAKSLADAGARVLLVDADIEAPSLDAILDVTALDPSTTLLGLCGWADEVNTIPSVYVGRPLPGAVDLVPCRPKSSDFDMDFASFLLGATLDARLLQRAAERLKAKFSDAGSPASSIYDFVFFDHRTGLAPSVLPLLAGWPGPAVIFSRPDGMSRHGELRDTLSALLHRGSDTPGAFVTFSLDPKETVESVAHRDGRYVENFLEMISDAIQGGGDIDPAELMEHWILWRHDNSLLSGSNVRVEHLNDSNRNALQQLREVLGLEFEGRAAALVTPAKLTKSGATDEGMFILTPDIARIFSRESKILYIFGRKGTGKTRLVRELHQQRLGEPLLGAHDFDEGGIQSGGIEFSALLRACGDRNYAMFWWALLGAAVENVGGEKESLRSRVMAIASMTVDERSAYASPENVAQLMRSNETERRVFLIDGVETAVPAAQLRDFVESLFLFLATVQYSKVLSSGVVIRLFLRSDLHKSAAQNVEQQIEGSVLYLRWDRTAILNFAVARLASLSWFKSAFLEVCNEIESEIPRIAHGALPDERAEELLLKVFPIGLERNKVKTTTFFSTYFSDAGGDSEAKASFYPRLFDGFLREMDEAARDNRAQTPLEGGRLRSGFVLESYDAASAGFIAEVETELQNLLDFGLEDAANRDAVKKLLEGFNGLKTPFVLDDILRELSLRTELPTGSLRDALGKMKQLGIFEDRPGYPGYWRTGRLFKAGLNMKYVRTKGGS